MEWDNLDAGEPAVEPPIVTGAPDARRASRWKVSPHFELTATSDDNIFITPDDQVEDFIFTASPGLAVGYWDYEEEMERYLDRKRSASVVERGVGNFLVLDYTAILLGFVKTSSQNAFDQDARLDGGWQLGRLTLGAGAQFESKSEADIDVGGRLRRKTFSAEVTANYQLSERTAVSVNFYHVAEERENFIRTTEWRNEDYIDYQFTPMLTGSLGVALGKIDVQDNDNQTFERILGRLNFESGAKLSFGLRGGVEFRQVDGDEGDQVNPVFDFSVRYAVAEKTLLAFDGFRRVETSALHPDEIYTATGCVLRCERSLRSNLRLSVEGGYTHTEYGGAASDGRKDDYFHGRAGLLYNFARWANAGVSYEFRKDDSSRAASSFENNRITVQLGLIY